MRFKFLNLNLYLLYLSHHMRSPLATQLPVVRKSAKTARNDLSQMNTKFLTKLRNLPTKIIITRNISRKTATIRKRSRIL
jgi:hypothetical protein